MCGCVETSVRMCMCVCACTYVLWCLSLFDYCRFYSVFCGGLDMTLGGRVM